MIRFHLDTDFLIKAIGQSGPERVVIRRVQDSDAEIEISSLAWYEFCRGWQL